MSQQEIDRAVAQATGENRGLIRSLGFSIADPVNVCFDPEPQRHPLVLDWDTMTPTDWRNVNPDPAQWDCVDRE